MPPGTLRAGDMRLHLSNQPRRMTTGDSPVLALDLWRGADMYAIRLARAFTRKPKILKFEGSYHGMWAEAHKSRAPARAGSQRRERCRGRLLVCVTVAGKAAVHATKWLPPAP